MELVRKLGVGLYVLSLGVGGVELGAGLVVEGGGHVVLAKEERHEAGAVVMEVRLQQGTGRHDSRSEWRLSRTRESANSTAGRGMCVMYLSWERGKSLTREPAPDTKYCTLLNMTCSRSCTWLMCEHH